MERKDVIHWKYLPTKPFTVVWWWWALWASTRLAEIPGVLVGICIGALAFLTLAVFVGWALEDECKPMLTKEEP